jgi:hypothetical protein
MCRNLALLPSSEKPTKLILLDTKRDFCHLMDPVVEIKLKSVPTQLNFPYYTELRVSTYFRSSSGLLFVFKTYRGTNITYVPSSIYLNTNCEPEDDLK